MPRPKGEKLLPVPADKPRNTQKAYAFFVQTCRDEHRRKHPEEQVDFVEFSKRCAERWKTMSDREKKRFVQMEQSDQKRYDLEMASYAAATDEGRRGRKSKKKVKDPNAPKRSMSAFFWFSQDERPKVKAANPNFGVGEIAKELGRRWADAETTTKSRYESMAEKDRERYTKEKKEYQQKQKGVKNGRGKAKPGRSNSASAVVQSDVEDDVDDDSDF